MTYDQRRWLFLVSAPIAGGLATMAGVAIAFLVVWSLG
jgi:hypothetical protein